MDKSGRLEKFVIEIKAIAFTLLLILVTMIPNAINLYIAPQYRLYKMHRKLIKQDVQVGDILIFGNEICEYIERDVISCMPQNKLICVKD